LIIDRQTMRSKCFAFVYFNSIESAIKAKEELVGMTLHGRQLRVDFSVTKKAHSPTPGKYLGKSASRSYKPPSRPYSRYPGSSSSSSSSSSYDYYSRRSPSRRDYYEDSRGRYERDRPSSSSSSYDRYDRYDRGGGGGGGGYDVYDSRSYDRYSDRGGYPPSIPSSYDRGFPPSYDRLPYPDYGRRQYR